MYNILLESAMFKGCQVFSIFANERLVTQVFNISCKYDLTLYAVFLKILNEDLGVLKNKTNISFKSTETNFFMLLNV